MSFTNVIDSDFTPYDDGLNLVDQITESPLRTDVCAYNADLYLGTPPMPGLATTGRATSLHPTGFALHLRSTLDTDSHLTVIRTTRASSDRQS